MSVWCSTWLGALVAAPLARRRVRPSWITLVGLLGGLATSVVAWWCVTRGHAAAAAAVAVVGWQLAYVVDCSDGMVARATGTTSAHGARLDVLTDFAVQAGVVAVCATAVDGTHLCPSWVQAAFAITWTINLFVGTLSRIDGKDGHSLLSDRRSVHNELARLLRDYPFQALVLAVALGWPRRALPVAVVAFAVLHAGFLVASLANEARLGLRDTRGR
jgi:phosphatidylglycerophosphate synthase